jgi:hypothetical protein
MLALGVMANPSAMELLAEELELSGKKMCRC